MERSDYPIRKHRLEDAIPETDYAKLTAEERFELVWTLTLQAWEFKEGWRDEQRLRRDVWSFRRLGG